MPFYKRHGETLSAAPNFVAGPGLELRAEDRAAYSYPVEGWTWYDDLDAAMTALRSVSIAVSVTPRQARLALQQAGLLDTITAWIASADATTRIEWEFALEVRRDWPPILVCASALGLTEEQLDGLFAQAATL